LGLLWAASSKVVGTALLLVGRPEMGWLARAEMTATAERPRPPTKIGSRGTPSNQKMAIATITGGLTLFY